MGAKEVNGDRLGRQNVLGMRRIGELLQRWNVTSSGCQKSKSVTSTFYSESVVIIVNESPARRSKKVERTEG